MRTSKILASAAMLAALYGVAYAAAAMPTGVKMQGDLLTDAKGMSLYTFANDKEANKSACNGNCANAWPALKADAADKNMGDWTVITRDDGSKQWAYKGHPLYYFAMDKAAGEKTGEGRGNGVWHLAKE
jgi:predicted lipoprotein with Yx(FWY)xxD motif